MRPRSIAIFDASFSETFGHLYRPEDLAAFLTSFAVERLAANSFADPAYAFRLAEVDGEPAGYAKIGPPQIPVETDRPAIAARSALRPQEHHGAGVAQVLMDWAIDAGARDAAPRTCS